MLSVYVGIIFLLLPGSSVGWGAADPWSGWEPTVEKDGVKIFRKHISNSSLLAFGGEGIVDAPVVRVATAIFDTTRSPEWIEDLEESRILRWISPLEYVEYNHVGTPFVLKDREFVSIVRIELNPDRTGISFSYQAAADGELPPSRWVRGDITGTRFVLSPLDGGRKTHVHGEIHADPRGSVPKWIVNLFQKSWPVVTFQNLRKHVAKPDVQNSPKMVELLQPVALKESKN